MLRRLMLVETQTQSHSLTLTTFLKLLCSPPDKGNPAWGLLACLGPFGLRGDQSLLPLQRWAWYRALVPRALTSEAPFRSQSSSLPDSPCQEQCRRPSLQSPEFGGPKITRAQASSLLPGTGLHRPPSVAFTGGNSLLE